MPKPQHERVFEGHVHWARLKPEEFVWTPCVLCGSPQYEVLASLIINWVEFFVVKCSACGLMWRNPLPDSAFLNDLYSEQYYNVAAHSPSLVYQVGIADSEPPDQNKRRDITRREVRDWESRGIKPKTAFGDGRVLLEIGGGRGNLQQAAGELGWNTLGLEISPHGIKAAIEKGLIVLPVTLDELCDKFIPYRRYFDAVVFFDFLEHVTDPGKVLRMVRHILKDDGVIILRVPITVDIPRLHLIDHIFHFTRETVPALLEREGFAVTSSHDSGIFKSPSGDRLENITVFANKQET